MTSLRDVLRRRTTLMASRTVGLSLTRVERPISKMSRLSCSGTLV